MDQLLKKIDEVRNRTGVDYVEAKVALDNCGGDVLEAIIYIEQKRQSASKRHKIKSKASDASMDIIYKLKELIKKGNVVRIIIKKDDRVIMNIPVVAGIVGVIAFTGPTIISVLTSIAMGCRVYVVKKDNTMFEIREILEDTAKTVSTTISNKMSKNDGDSDEDLDEDEIEEFEEWLFSEEDNELLDRESIVNAKKHDE